MVRPPQSELGQRAHLSLQRSTADSSCWKARRSKNSAQLNPRALGYDLTVIVEVKAAKRARPPAR